MIDLDSTFIEEFEKELGTEETTKESGLFPFFLNYVNILEGIKTQIKNLHWASLMLPDRSKRGAHIYLDDFHEEVSDFQDLVAESAMGITGTSFKMNTVSGTPFNASSTKDLMNYVQNKTLEFYSNIPQTPLCAGIKSETETFILKVNQYVYRFELTE